MLELKKDVQVWVPVRMIDPAGVPIVGLTDADVVCSVFKSDGTEVTQGVGPTTWEEATVGALADAGVYRVRLSAGLLDVLGFLTYAIQDSATPPNIFVGLADIVAYLQPAPTPYVSFTANGDTVAPIILQVASPKHTQVRVTFSEAVVMTTASNGALNLSNYDIPGLTITAATATTAQQVVLTTSTQTPNLLYTLTVTNVEDLQGNPIA
jgi:hypothetical protein